MNIYKAPAFAKITALNAGAAERWQSVFDNSAIGVALMDLNGRFLATNPAYQKMLGYTEEEFRALSFLDITHEDYRESNWALATELLEGKREQFQIEKQYRGKDGTLIWVRNNVSLVPGTESVPLFLMALSEDISERKKAEEALQKREERSRTLLEINNAIITRLAPDALLHSVAETLRRLIPFNAAAFTLYDPQKDTFRVVTEGLCSDYFRDGLEFDRKESIAGWVLDHRRAALRRNLEKEQQYPNDRRLLADGIRSHCVVPLVINGRCLGTLHVASQMRNQYSETDSEFLQEVANQVALAVENTQAYEQIVSLNTEIARTGERRRKLLELNNAIMTNLSQEALLRSISEGLRQVVPFDRAALTLYLPERGAFRFLAIEGGFTSDYFRPGLEIDPKESSVAWVLDHQEPLLRRNLEKEQEYSNERRLAAEGIRSHCVVPLIVRGKSIGTLNVASAARDQYTTADAELLQEVANQVALTIENMKSYEEIATLNSKVARTADHLRSLLEINNAIITNLTQESLLRSISKALRPAIPFDRCAITLYNPEKDTFRFLAVEGVVRSDYFQAGLEVKRSETSAGWVFDHQKPLLRRDLEKEQQFPNECRLSAEGIRSLCAAPLALLGKCIGTLSVVSQIKHQYSEADAEFLQEVANQIALAVENMRSYEEIAVLKERLERENIYLKEEILTDHNFEEIVGNSPALLAVLRAVEQVAATDSTVLIYGETGTGKELIARAIHNRSARKDRTLVIVDCSAISAGLVESELFGHLKGAFTGALERHIGRFELADGATIFLDEVGELPAETQVKLLRVLQEREFDPVGSNRPVRVDVRVIAATNRDLEKSVQAGRFRSDLYYRLNVFPIEVPPLRDRAPDIPQLAMFFLSRYSRKLGKSIGGLSQNTMERLIRYAWPGNVRELQNVIERAVILSRGSILELEPEVFPVPAFGVSPDSARSAPEMGVGQPPSPPPATPSTLEAIERAHITAVLKQAGGVIEGPNGAARILSLHPNTLRHRMKKLGIERSARRLTSAT